MLFFAIYTCLIYTHFLVCSVDSSHSALFQFTMLHNVIAESSYLTFISTLYLIPFVCIKQSEVNLIRPTPRQMGYYVHVNMIHNYYNLLVYYGYK